MSGTEDGDVLTPPIGKAAEPVEELQLGTRAGRFASGLLRGRLRRRRGDPFGGTLEADDLIRKTAPAA